VSYKIKPKEYTTTLLNTYIVGELEWFGSLDYDKFEESCLNISTIYNIFKDWS